MEDEFDKKPAASGEQNRAKKKPARQPTDASSSRTSKSAPSENVVAKANPPSFHHSPSRRPRMPDGDEYTAHPPSSSSRNPTAAATTSATRTRSANITNTAMTAEAVVYDVIEEEVAKKPASKKKKKRKKSTRRPPTAASSVPASDVVAPNPSQTHSPSQQNRIPTPSANSSTLSIVAPASDSSTMSDVVPIPTPVPPTPTQVPPPLTRASRVPSRRPQVPGAVAVGGLDPSHDGDDYTITAQSHPPLPNPTETVTVEARLVEGDEQDVEVLQEELQQRNEELQQRDLELERLRRERQNVAVAQVLANDEENPPAPTNRAPKLSCLKSRKAKLILLGVSIIVLAVIFVGVVLSVNDSAPPSPTTPASAPSLSQPTSSPSLPQVTLMELLSSVSPDEGSALRTPLTAQNKAYEWLNGNEKLGSYSGEQKIQRYSLATLYYSTNGDAWTKNDGWLSDNDECGWFNTADDVFCSNGAVVELDLYDNNLVGTIPVEIALLSNSLAKIDLDDNDLKGTFPTEIGMLTRLCDIDLSHNGLTGTFPTEIAMLTGLNVIQCSSNGLAGPIPTEIGLLTNLSSLSLQGNAFTGSIPTQIALMTSLNHWLSLGNNNMTGSIPTEIGLLTALLGLWLFGNGFTGTIPSEIALLTDLVKRSITRTESQPPGGFSGSATCFLSVLKWCHDGTTRASNEARVMMEREWETGIMSCGRVMKQARSSSLLMSRRGSVQDFPPTNIEERGQSNLCTPTFSVNESTKYARFT